MDYLAVCCVFKDESRYLREWVEYHRIVGVERFYMVSNDDSPDQSRNVLEPYIATDEVIFFTCPGGPFVSLQNAIYVEILRRAVGHARWLAFLDIDEFLLPVEAKNVPEVLSGYDRFPALAVNWACFGSSGLAEAPALQTAAFRMRVRDDNALNRVYKSIVDPGRALEPYSPHGFVLKEPWRLVDEFGAAVTHPWRNENDPFFGRRIRINHYRIRSASEFREKLLRWRNGGHPELQTETDVRLFWEKSDLNEVRDDAIQRFVPELARRLAISY